VVTDAAKPESRKSKMWGEPDSVCGSQVENVDSELALLPKGLSTDFNSSTYKDRMMVSSSYIQHY
jgi:hypothetical protein